MRRQRQRRNGRPWLHLVTADGRRGRPCDPEAPRPCDGSSSFLSSSRTLGAVPRRVQSVLEIGCAAVQKAAHRLTPQTLRQTVELLDQGGQHGSRVEQVDCDEMVRDQHLTELQIVFHTVAEQPARKFPAFASCRNNPALPAPTRSGELSRKPQPRRQIECRNRLPYQRINRPDLLPRQQLNDEFSHGAPAVSLIPQACTRTFSESLTWINARVAGAIFNVS
jgi:hypothetical protein